MSMEEFQEIETFSKVYVKSSMYCYSVINDFCKLNLYSKKTYT